MSKLVNCKACKKEIAKGVKKCPSCGKDQRNFFGRHKVLTGIVVVIVIVVMSNTNKKDATSTVASSNTASTTTSTPATKTTPVVPKRQVTGTATDLGTGTFKGGTDIKAGLYEVTPVQGQGNFTVTSKNGALNVNEVLGQASGMGVTQVRTKISNDDKIQLQGINKVHFQPVATPFVTTEQVEVLHSGEWIVGQDIVAGRYKAVATSGSGNFVVFTDGMPGTNEILGGDSASGGVKQVSVDLTNGDVINIASINKATLTPVK